jgi:hypothetical protein
MEKKNTPGGQNGLWGIDWIFFWYNDKKKM